ncbi:flagellar basal body-associated FliL family protein [Teichococcus aestuarii]|uniref:Flagellar protein FliL n=1 Tax=Teichococcus aestuarii TaxID=568898 RepID=A0A2U1V2Y5_9PROT|nr:flagellar basal body-associated FliL family protein [Pseudoroseomonas aestuarii]PWC28270.1 flagellar basal body protein FliL [Pseudoroseomonas aestuarii]
MSGGARGEKAPKEKTGGGRRKAVLLAAAAVLLLGGGGAGAWLGGLLPWPAPWPGAAAPAEAKAAPPVFVEVPDIIANLNTAARRQTFIKLRAKLEVEGPAQAAALQASMPRLLDIFTTYLRETRPEELRGSAGTHRLREEMMARANVAAAPVRVTDVLFVELVMQ